MNKVSIPIDNTIRKAIRAIIEKYGSQAELGRLTGINQNSFSRYISEKNKSIKVSTWNILYPYMKDYLPKDYVQNMENDSNNFLNIIGYNHGSIVVRSITNITTEKEIKLNLINRIAHSNELDEKNKLKMIKLINEE